MIYIYNREHSVISNYLNVTDRCILSWSDVMNLDGYSSLILHRYKLPREWTRSHPNRYQYKNLSDLKTHLIKENNIILLHPPNQIDDVYQLLQDPSLISKDWWLFGLTPNLHQSGFIFEGEKLQQEYEIITDLDQYLKSLHKILLRDRKLEQIFNI